MFILLHKTFIIFLPVFVPEIHLKRVNGETCFTSGIESLWQLVDMELIVGFCILLHVYSLTLFLKTTVCNNVFCARFYCALLTTCFGLDRWPSSGNMYIKYTKVTTVYVNGPVEIAASRQVPWSGESKHLPRNAPIQNTIR
jgi:hypothetical protein